MTIDLGGECDPPSYKQSRKKAKVNQDQPLAIGDGYVTEQRKNKREIEIEKHVGVIMNVCDYECVVLF